MKHSQRLEYSRLASAIVERGLSEAKRVHEALQIAENGHGAFADVLVNSNIVTDWELSNVVCDIYNLPFLTVDVVEPDPAARRGLDLQFLATHGLVPLYRCNGVLTVSMPGMVSADVLGEMTATTDLTILPVVGSVQSNRRWIAKVLEDEIKAALPSAQVAAEEEQPMAGWDQMFDVADAAVHQSSAEPLVPAPLPSPKPMRQPPAVPAATAGPARTTPLAKPSQPQAQMPRPAAPKPAAKPAAGANLPPPPSF